MTAERALFSTFLLTSFREQEVMYLFSSDVIRYALERWTALLRFCEDGRIQMDNNAAERALCAVAVGSSLCTSFSST